jgi:hypothetical protein
MSHPRLIGYNLASMDRPALPPQTSTGVTSDSIAPTTENVLRLLDSEIAEVQSAETRNGLNVWVVLAAIVALLWLLTGELGASSLDWVNTTRLVVAEWLCIDGLKWLYFVLRPQPAGETNQARFHWSHQRLGSKRALWVIELLRSISLLLVVSLTHAFGWHVRVPVVVVYCLYSYAALVTLIGSYTPLFVVSPRLTKSTYAYFAFLFVCSVTALAFLIPLLPAPTGQAMSGYRISGLIVGISYLFFIFGLVLSRSSLVSTLTELRRKLATGKMSLGDSIHHIEIALGGMQVTDALRDDSLTLLALLDAMDQQTNNAMIAISSIESNLPTPDDDPAIAESKLVTIDSLVAGYESIFNERQVLFDRYLDQISRFNELADKISAISSSRSSISEIERLIQSRATTSDQTLAKFQARVAEANKKLKQAGVSEAVL